MSVCHALYNLSSSFTFVWNVGIAGNEDADAAMRYPKWKQAIVIRREDTKAAATRTIINVW